MKLHANAALSLNQRRRLAKRVNEQGWSAAKVAGTQEVSQPTARKWAHRYASEGEAGLLDRPSAANQVWNRTPDDRIEAICVLRRLRFTGAEIVHRSPLNASSTAFLMAADTLRLWLSASSLSWSARARGSTACTTIARESRLVSLACVTADPSFRCPRWRSGVCYIAPGADVPRSASTRSVGRHPEHARDHAQGSDRR
jgi:hypothetical protein